MKKILSVCLVLMLMLACISTQAMAEDTPTFAAGNAAAYPGETVEIPILIENNPGIVALSVNISFDSSVLTLQDASAAESVFNKEGLDPDESPITFGGSYDTDSFNIIWYDATSLENYTVNGTIATLTFLIKEDAPVGESVLSVSYVPASVMDMDLHDVAFGTRNGVVTVLPTEVGGWSFTEDSGLYIYEGGNGVNYVCGLDSLYPVISDYIETTGGWSFELELNEFDLESTGAKLTICDENGDAVEEYYSVLFGDVNGDGGFDLTDVSLLMDAMGGNIDDEWTVFFDTDEFPQSFAADPNHDLTLDLTDVGFVCDQLGGEDIDQSVWF